MKMLIDVEPLEYEKMVYCIRKYNDQNGLSANDGMNHSSIVEYAVGKLANEYINDTLHHK